MTIPELQTLRDSIEQQYKNLSDSAWVHTQQEQLRGKYEILNEMITQLEQEEAAKVKEEEDAANKPAQRQANSHNNKRK